MIFPLIFSTVTSERKKILIVEDNIETQLIFKIYLRDKYDVDVADDAEKGIDLLQKNKYDLLLLDINLPGRLNGEDVLKEVRNGMDLPAFPVFVVTAYALKGDKEKFLQLGANKYISKPVEKAILRKEIEEYLF